MGPMNMLVTPDQVMAILDRESIHPMPLSCAGTKAIQPSALM